MAINWRLLKSSLNSPKRNYEIPLWTRPPTHFFVFITPKYFYTKGICTCAGRVGTTLASADRLVGFSWWRRDALRSAGLSSGGTQALDLGISAYMAHLNQILVSVLNPFDLFYSSNNNNKKKAKRSLACRPWSHQADWLARLDAAIPSHGHLDRRLHDIAFFIVAPTPPGKWET